LDGRAKGGGMWMGVVVMLVAVRMCFHMRVIVGMTVTMISMTMPVMVSMAGPCPWRVVLCLTIHMDMLAGLKIDNSGFRAISASAGSTH